ncbi:hypothetical protein D3C78_1236120 [compost metagenome]
MPYIKSAVAMPVNRPVITGDIIPAIGASTGMLRRKALIDCSQSMPAPTVNRPAMLFVTTRITSEVGMPSGGQSSNFNASHSLCMLSRIMVTTLAEVVTRLFIRKVSRLLINPCKPPLKNSAKASLNLPCTRLSTRSMAAISRLSRVSSLSCVRTTACTSTKEPFTNSNNSTPMARRRPALPNSLAPVRARSLLWCFRRSPVLGRCSLMASRALSMMGLVRDSS